MNALDQEVSCPRLSVATTFSAWLPMPRSEISMAMIPSGPGVSEISSPFRVMNKERSDIASSLIVTLTESIVPIRIVSGRSESTIGA